MSIASIKSSLLDFYQSRDYGRFKARSLEFKQELDDLLAVSLNHQEEKYAIIGSWVCTHIVEKDPKPFQKVQAEILDFLEKGTHQTSLRSWMKVATYLEFDEIHHGRLIDICTRNISNNANKVALQVYSIYTLIPMVHIYPELLDEIESLIELHSMDKTVSYAAAWRNFKKKTKKTSVVYLFKIS